MNFFYEATDSTGQTIMGRLDGASESDVRQTLLRMGYEPRAVALNPAQPTLQAMPAQQPSASMITPSHVTGNTTRSGAIHGARSEEHTLNSSHSS